jgi:hypothetical protein
VSETDCFLGQDALRDRARTNVATSYLTLWLYVIYGYNKIAYTSARKLFSEETLNRKY